MSNPVNPINTEHTYILPNKVQLTNLNNQGK